MAKAKQSVAKSEFVQRNLEAGLERLAIASAAGERAVEIRGRDGKKLAVAVKRLAKRRASLIRRKKLAATRVRKSPSGETRKALRTAVRELAGTNKELGKARASKAANAVEFAALRLAQRRASGYARAIAQVDRALGTASA